MRLMRSGAWALAFVISVVMVLAAPARAAEKRLALVIGEAAYAGKPLATPANDAGLVAQNLQAAGFDVTGARDLEEGELKQTFRDFLDKVSAAGTDAVALIYFAGYGLQLEGENYLLPIDTAIKRDTDIPLRALRVSDYAKPLAASGAKLGVVILDAARANPFQMSGQPLAGGLALYEPGPRMLVAFNAAPGTVAPEGQGPYGVYAHALAEMIRDGGASLMDVFDRTRLRVSDATKGAQIPWNSERIDTDFVFFQRAADAPPREDDVARAEKPIKELGPQDGYAAAVRRDTLKGYEDYVVTYPAAPSAKRVRALIAARREALTWRRTRSDDTPNAYWTYLRRYPNGPHAYDCRRRLAYLSSAMEPPEAFEPIAYDLPPPPPEEIIYVSRPVIVFDDPVYELPPPPPPPVYILPPPPPDFIALPPPVVIATPYVLPAPVYRPVPVWQAPPRYIAPPPPDNFIYANMHNAVAVDPAEHHVVVRDRGGAVVSTGALLGAAAAGAGAVAVGATLPHFIAKKVGVAPPPQIAPGGPAVQPPVGRLDGPAADGSRRGPGLGVVPGVPAPGGLVPGGPGGAGAQPFGKPPAGKLGEPVSGGQLPGGQPTGGQPIGGQPLPGDRPVRGARPEPGVPTPAPGGSGKDHVLPAPSEIGGPGGASNGRPAGTPVGGAPNGGLAGKDHTLPLPKADGKPPGPLQGGAGGGVSGGGATGGAPVDPSGDPVRGRGVGKDHPPLGDGAAPPGAPGAGLGAAPGAPRTGRRGGSATDRVNPPALREPGGGPAIGAEPDPRRDSGPKRNAPRRLGAPDAAPPQPRREPPPMMQQPPRAQPRHEPPDWREPRRGPPPNMRGPSPIDDGPGGRPAGGMGRGDPDRGGPDRDGFGRGPGPQMQPPPGARMSPPQMPRSAPPSMQAPRQPPMQLPMQPAVGPPRGAPQQMAPPQMPRMPSPPRPAGPPPGAGGGRGAGPGGGPGGLPNGMPPGLR